MTAILSRSVDCGMIPTDSQYQRAGVPGRPTRASAPNPLERLVQLVQANDRLMVELATSRDRVARARANLDTPGSHVAFGMAHLDRCRVRHAGILAQLRANRIEALGLLGPAGPSL